MRGVKQKPDTLKYEARICVNKRIIIAGASFETLEEALRARKELELKYKFQSIKGLSLEDKLRKCLKYCKNSGKITVKRWWHRYSDLGREIGTDFKGYRKSNIFGKSLLNHRLAWFLYYNRWPAKGLDIDHINGIKSDNRIENLREVTRALNSRNSKLSKKSKTKIPGVNWNKRGKKWEAQIRWVVGGPRHRIYYGDDFFEACCARKSAELKLNYHKNHGRKA